MIVLWRIGVRSSCRSGSKALGPEATVSTSTSREEKTERTFPRLSHGVHALAAPSQRLMLAISGPRNSITSLCLLDLDSCDRCEVFSSIAAPSMAAEVGGWARSCSRRATSAIIQRRAAECRCCWMSRVERRARDGRVRLSGFGNIAPWWRVPFRVVARRETESPGRNYDLRAPVGPQVKQEASTPWFLHPSRRFDASKQRVSLWTVVNRDGYWTDHAHAGEEEGSSIRHPQAPRRTTSPWLGGPMRSDREPRFGSHGSTVPLYPLSMVPKAA